MILWLWRLAQTLVRNSTALTQFANIFGLTLPGQRHFFQTILRRCLPPELPSADDPCFSLLNGCTNYLLDMKIFNKSHKHSFCAVLVLYSKKRKYLERQFFIQPTIGKTEFGAELHKLCKELCTVVFLKLWLNVKSVEFSNLCSKKMYWRTCPYFYLCK